MTITGKVSNKINVVPVLEGAKRLRDENTSLLVPVIAFPSCNAVSEYEAASPVHALLPPPGNHFSHTLMVAFITSLVDNAS